MPDASPPPAVPLTARVVRGIDAVRGLGSAWDDLTSRARGAPAFLARSWMTPWIESGRTRGEPVALTAWAGDRLVGLFVLAVRSRAGVRVAVPATTGSPGYLGLLVDPDHPDAPLRLAALCVEAKAFHALSMEDVSTADAPTLAFLDGLAARGLQVARAHRNPCRRIHLGRSYDAYLLETKSKKSRANLRREEKKLKEGAAVELVRLEGAEITSDVMARVAAVQEASWMKERGAAVLGEPVYREMTLSAARAGLARLWLVTIDGKDAAFVYALVLHGHLHYVWTAFRLEYEPLSVGKVLTGWTVRDACAAGVLTFDFGQGDGHYKQFWSNDVHDVLRVAAGRGPAGATFVLSRRALWGLARVTWIKSTYRSVKRALRGRSGPTPAAAAAAPQEPESD